MATYTVDNTFTADTTAIASEVNQNFTNVLEALNSFDAANLTGTISLARISNLTTTQFATNVVDTDDTLAADSDTRLVSQSAVKSYIAAQVAASVTMSAYTTDDSESNAMLKSHAYLAQTDGFVAVQSSDVDFGEFMRLYVDTDSDPVTGGNLVAEYQSAHNDINASINGWVASGEYFEVTFDGDAPTIYWKSLGALVAPVDQD